MLVVKLLVGSLLVIVDLQFLYNFLAALRNRNTVLQKFPQSQAFLRMWTLFNAVSLFLVSVAICLLPSQFILALILAACPIVLVIFALLKQHQRRHLQQ